MSHGTCDSAEGASTRFAGGGHTGVTSVDPLMVPRFEQAQFNGLLIALLPKLRAQAFALTHNRAAADDLVQDAVVSALAAWQSFTPGTNFAGWMHRIVRNRFISNLRKSRDTMDVEDVPAEALAVAGSHEDSFALKELARALNQIPLSQREPLLMVVLQGMSYEEVAAVTGCAVGTAKSRVFRARRQLQALLMGETQKEPAEQVGTSGPVRDDGRAETRTYVGD